MSDYVLGFDKPVINKIKSRSIREEASFIVPYLRDDGLNILDAGCGPGSISVDIARSNEKNIVYAVDKNSDQFTTEDVPDNLFFQEQDLNSLNFSDDKFDIVFSHTVFMHLPEPEVVAKELLRVLKPGGLLLLREGVGVHEYFPSLSVKTSSGLMKFQEFLDFVLKSSKGTPNFGLVAKEVLHRAGFSIEKFDTHSVAYSSPNELYLLKEWYQSMILGNLGNLAIRKGLVAKSELLRVSKELDLLPLDYRNTSVVVWGDIVAVKA